MSALHEQVAWDARQAKDSYLAYSIVYVVSSDMLSPCLWSPWESIGQNSTHIELIQTHDTLRQPLLTCGGQAGSRACAQQ
jgi:hypothetical protein